MQADNVKELIQEFVRIVTQKQVNLTESSGQVQQCTIKDKILKTMYEDASKQVYLSIEAVNELAEKIAKGPEDFKQSLDIMRKDYTYSNLQYESLKNTITGNDSNIQALTIIIMDLDNRMNDAYFKMRTKTNEAKFLELKKHMMDLRKVFADYRQALNEQEAVYNKKKKFLPPQVKNSKGDSNKLKKFFKGINDVFSEHYNQTQPLLESIESLWAQINALFKVVYVDGGDEAYEELKQVMREEGEILRKLVEDRKQARLLIEENPEGIDDEYIAVEIQDKIIAQLENSKETITQISQLFSKITLKGEMQEKRDALQESVSKLGRIFDGAQRYFNKDMLDELNDKALTATKEIDKNLVSLKKTVEEIDGFIATSESFITKGDQALKEYDC